MTYTVAEAARILGVDREQVKYLAFVFADSLSLSANPAKGKARSFTFTDMLMLLYINQHWEEDPDIPAIKMGLNSGEHAEDIYLYELWRHTPLLQDDASEYSEDSPVGLRVNPQIYLHKLELARSYRNAANLLWQNAADSGLPTLEAYPVLYAYRHAVELYLKILGNTGKGAGHNLVRCVQAVEKIHAMRLPDKKLPTKLREWILTLHQLDETGSTFRYQQELSPILDDIWMDWAHFRFAMGELLEALDYACLRKTDSE